jgi:hypothetical protein
VSGSSFPSRRRRPVAVLCSGRKANTSERLSKFLEEKHNFKFSLIEKISFKKQKKLDNRKQHHPKIIIFKYLAKIFYFTMKK